MGQYCETLQPCDSFYAHYDNTKHILNQIEKTDNGKTTYCYTYRCKDVTQGFTSNSDHSCVDCLGDTRKKNIINGLCVQCPVGSIIDETKTSGDYCVSVPKDKQLTKSMLLYGKNGQETMNISNQCWTFSDRDIYKECITKGAEAAKQKMKSQNK